MPAKRRYQDGGDVEVDQFDEPVGGLAGLGVDLGSFDSVEDYANPMAPMMAMLGNYGTTTNAAKLQAQSYLDKMLAAQGAPAESSALARKKAQTTAVRAALKMAREKLVAQEYNRGDALLAASAALGSPTKFGTIGETMGNVSQALREPIANRRKFSRDRDEQLSQLDIADATADAGEIDAELALENLDRRMKNQLAVEAFKTLGKPIQGAGNINRNPLKDVVPAAAKSRDAVYAKEQYLPWVTGGGAKAAQGIKSLRGIQAQLAQPGDKNLTGGLTSLIYTLPVVGRAAKDVLNPEAADLRDTYERTIQESLRPILGSQFTREEGERLIARTFNERLDEKYNARRLDYFLEQIERAAQNQAALAEHYQSYGTTYGFQGPTNYSVEDFYVPDWVGDPKVDPVAARLAGGLPPEEEVATPENEAEGLSDAAAASIRSGVRLDSPEDREFLRNNPVRRASGGRARRGFQEGGFALSEPDFEISQPDEVVLPRGFQGDPLQLEEDDPLTALTGAVSGLGANAVLGRIQRRLSAPKAVGKIESAMARDGADPEMVIRELEKANKAGVPQDLMTVDIPGVRALAQNSLKSGGVEASQVLDELEANVSGSRERVKDRVNVGLKPFPYTAHENKLLDNISQDARKTLFDPIYKAAPPMKADPVISQILATPEGQSAVEYAQRFYLNRPGATQADVDKLNAAPTLEYYDRIRGGLDNAIAKEGDTDYGPVLRDLRDVFVKRLEKMAPKEYKTARADYAGDLEVRDALYNGKKFMDLTSEELATMAKTMPFHEKNAFRTGMAQKLFETLDRSSADNYNAAQDIVNSPAIMARIRPFFDNTQQFKLFEFALKKEQELFRSGNQLIEGADKARTRTEANLQTPVEYSAKKMPGFRAGISLTGWVLRMVSEMPKMSSKDAAKMLAILKNPDPKAMQLFAKQASRLTAIRGQKGMRRATAAGLGAVAADALSDDGE